jgi:hypothetical protein
LFSYSIERFRREWLMLTVSVVLYFALSLGGSLLAAIPQTAGERYGFTAPTVIVLCVMYGASYAIQGIALLGMTRVVVDVLQGGHADPVRVFSQTRKVGRYLLQLLVIVTAMVLFVGAFLGLAAIIAIARGAPPTIDGLLPGPFTGEAAVLFLIAAAIAIGLGVYLFIPAYFASLELVLSDRIGPIDALRNCYAVVRGRRLIAFGVLIAMGVLALLGMLACCVGFLPAFAFSMLLYAGLYLSLRNGAALPVPD